MPENLLVFMQIKKQKSSGFGKVLMSFKGHRPSDLNLATTIYYRFPSIEQSYLLLRLQKPS